MLNDSEVVPLGDMLNSAIEPLKKALEQGEAREKHLREQWEAQSKENAKARRALAVLDPSVEPRKTKKNQGRGNTGFLISVERVQKTLDAIHELDRQGKAITQPDAREVCGLPQTSVSKAFRYLRNLEIIGRAGVDPATGREAYRIMNDVTELPESGTKQSGTTKQSKIRKAIVPMQARLEMIRKYLTDYGTEDMHVRPIDGKTAFTAGSLMNALHKAGYENINWDRSKGVAYVEALVNQGFLVDAGKHGDYRYFALAAKETPTTEEAYQWAN